jgi:hypothetical protein
MLGVHEYCWSPRHQLTISKLVCLFLSRPILNSVRSVLLGPSHHHLQSRKTMLVCTSTHGHQGTNTFPTSVCLVLDRSILGSVRSVTPVITPLVSHHLRLHETMLGVYEYAPPARPKFGRPILNSAVFCILELHLLCHES